MLVLAVWLAVDLIRARSQLSTARTGFVAVQDSLEQGDLPGARQRLTSASVAAREGADLANGLPARVFSRVPLTSDGVLEIRALARAVDTVGTRVLPPLLASDLRVPTWTGRIDAAPFLSAQQPLAKAEGELTAVQVSLDATRRAGIVQIANARDQLEQALVRITATVREARVAADVVPALSGQDGPKRYFVALQNNAESRATGGLLGAFAILKLDRGRLVLERVGQNDELVDREKPALDLGTEVSRRYGRFETARTWRSANLSPDVPTVGRLLVALWKAQTGERLDGALLMDPVALGQLLQATGPVELSDGSSINQNNAVSVLESGIYSKYPDVLQDDRYAFLAETAQRTFSALSTRSLDGRAVARQFATSVGTGHLQMWAADPAVQRRLLSSRVSGALGATGPYLSVVSNDVGGSKLDYYMHRTVTYAAKSTGVAVDLGEGPQLEEQADVSIQLDNRAPARGLPEYVTARPDDPSSREGQAHTWLSVYFGPRATLLQATLNGKEIAVESQTERGLSVYSWFVKIDPGKSAILKLTVKQPADPDQPLVYRQQPLVRDDNVQVSRLGSARPVEYFYSSSSGAPR